MSAMWVAPAVNPKAARARTKGSHMSRRQKPSAPIRPIARLAPATSVWNGLPGSQPMLAAVASAKTVWARKPLKPEKPRMPIAVMSTTS